MRRLVIRARGAPRRVGGGSERAPLLCTCALAVSMCSCDMLARDEFSVLSWAPGEGFVTEPFPIRIRFSPEPDRASVENAFSLLEDGEAVAGTFGWNGDTITFRPDAPPRPSSAYRLLLSGEARSPAGVSLEQPFEARFTTRNEEERPSVAGFLPGDGALLTDRFQTLTLRFSEPVRGASLGACLSLRPSTRGTWSPSPEGNVATFKPLEPWRAGLDYELRVSGELEDAGGMRMGAPWGGRFRLAGEGEGPVLLGVDAVGPDGLVAATLAPDRDDDGVVTRNAGWEGSWRLALRFSSTVRRSGLESRLLLTGGPGLSILGLGEESERFEVDLVGRPDWGALLVLELSPGVEDGHGVGSAGGAVYRLVADGPGSRPPRLAGIRLPLRPGEASASDRGLRAFASGGGFETLVLEDEAEAYPLGREVPTSMELYLELAEGAELDAVSIMESLRIAVANEALSVSVDKVRLGGIDWAEPHEPWSGFAVASVDARLRNGIGSGIVTVSLAAGLKDGAGNESAEAQAVALLK